MARKKKEVVIEEVKAIPERETQEQKNEIEVVKREINKNINNLRPLRLLR